MAHTTLGTIVLQEDNAPLIATTDNTVAMYRLVKHIAVRIAFIHEKVDMGVILINKVASENNLANFFTKPIVSTFDWAVSQLGLHPHPLAKRDITKA
ncbi:hypothetical protein H9P43_006132 [Blastocladiella emersonii ATCC 22665]|nr:hypothetical protein H9P43_006132 [Blastocladiella emersonii ATCC 22665]